MKSQLLSLCAALFLLVLPTAAFAGDGATIAFKSGQVAYIENGYGEIIKAMDLLNSQSSDHVIVKLSIGGGTFLLNVAEVVLVCRDRCVSVDFMDPRAEQRK